MDDRPPRLVVVTPNGRSPVATAAGIAWALLVLLVALLLIVPVLVVGIAALLAAAAWVWLRSLARRVRSDGRRNVRIVRDSDG